jgi:hypothetical protein
MASDDVAAAEQYTVEISAIVRNLKIPLVLFPYHLLCGEIAERQHRWKQAEEHYVAAARDLERHHARLHHDDLRVTFFKGRYHAYDALVRLALQQPEQEQALSSAYAWCERARSRGLIELLYHCAPPGRAQVDHSLLTKVNRLREELNTHYARSQSESRRFSRRWTSQPCQ